MSLFIDLKYLKLISSQLPLFKQKNEQLFNCRCIICGDSSKRKNKARGYFYVIKNDLLYKCHNCDVGMHFGTFLKNLNKILYDQYVLERFTTGLPANRAHNVIPEIFKMPEPTFCNNNKILQTIAVKLENLDETHAVVKFCENRKIPKNKYKELYYIDDVNKLESLSNKYTGRINSHESRLVIPFYDENKKLIGVTCRGLNNESIRYITIKINEDIPLIYGLDKINTNNKIYAVEGPIDSMFLDNAIAVGGVGFNKLNSIDNIDKDNLIVIIDNEPRNKDVVKIYNDIIEKGYKIVIWPQTIKEKDINDMVLNNRNINTIIKNNTFVGLEAKLKYIGWKRV